MPRAPAESRCVPSPNLAQAPVLDLLCAHFVLTLTLRQAGRFNLRRDWNSLLSLVRPHRVWPQPVLGRVRAFLARRCKGQAPWKGHEALGDAAFEPDEFLSQLEAEHRVKPEVRQRRGIGFQRALPQG